MFTRRVIMSIKPDSAAETRHILEDEVIPALRRQKGMRHDDTFISPELSEALLNSYWDTQEYSETYGRAAYPAALIALAGVLEGVPRVETFGISNSTFHRITARRREAHRASQLGRGGWTFAPLALHPSLRQQNTAAISCKTGERRVGAVTVLPGGE